MNVAHPAPFAPNSKSYFLDDFAQNALSALWGTNLGGGGSAVAIDNSFSTSKHLGTLRVDMGTNVGGRAALFLGLGNVLLGSSQQILEFIVRFPILSTVTDRYIARFGFGDTTNATDFNNGVYFEYDEATSANWRINTASSAVRTKTTTTVAVGTGFTRLGIRIIDTTSAEFFVNGVSVGTITTNIPTAGVAAVIKGNRVNVTAQRSFVVDYYYRETFFNGGRL